MRTFLESFCSTNAAVRRAVLLETLERYASGRVSVERTLWPSGSAAVDTVNYTVAFGTQQNGLTLGAHYDAVPGSPGANDNGAAVTQLVFAAAALCKAIANGQSEPDCSFVFFDHEELYGSQFMGSRVWLDSHSNALPASALIWDVTGTGRLYVSSHDRTGLLGDLETRETPPSDDANFVRAGIPTTLICALPDEQFHLACPHVWETLHSCEDSTDRVEDASLEAGKLLALEAVARFMRSRAS